VPFHFCMEEKEMPVSDHLCFALAGLCLVSFTSSRGRSSQSATAKEDPLPPPVFSLADLDRSADPAQDFFQFANGGWNKANPLPDEYSRWGTFTLLGKRNQQLIRAILEEAAAKADAGSSAPQSEERKIGDFYASGMDTAAINAAGLEPLRSELDRIQAIDGRQALLREIAHLQALGVNALFGFGQMQDFTDSTQVIGVAHQGGLGLPDRDYYLNEDDKSKAVRAAYVAHVAAMLGLAGENKDTAQTAAARILEFETTLARASMSRVDRRNPHNIYHPMDLAQLETLAPHLAWPEYFTLVDVPDLKSINVAQPGFFQEVDRQLDGYSLDDWKTYLRWCLLDETAPYLSDPFVDEDFKFSAVLSGAKQNLPRWQRVAAAEDRALGFAVGKLFVARFFPASSKAQVLEILHQVKAALKDDLAQLPWMSPATREQAIRKLSLIDEKIGYPDTWRDYSKLQIDRGSYVLNVLRANEFEHRRQLAKIGKPVDRTEWGMTPQTVNAYYNPSLNEIVFPAGILQPPFFDPAAPAALNYGAIGAVIGHEITHGFDDQGCQFDGQGNLKNWWTEEDLKRFQAATAAISDQFAQYTVAGGAHLQGKLVTGEAVADLGGVKLAWRAFQAVRSNPAQNAPDPQKYGDFAPDQLFFLGFAHVWAMNIRPEEAHRLVVVDPHPPAVWRVNGTLVNVPEFQKAFRIPDDSPMVNPQRAVIW
jgi:putative endopeptidase